jgi:hypothetical protein
VAALCKAGRIGFVNNGKLLSVFDFPITGGRQLRQTVTTSIPLNPGLQKVKLFSFIGGFNLNWLDVARAAFIQHEFHEPD